MFSLRTIIIMLMSSTAILGVAAAPGPGSKMPRELAERDSCFDTCADAGSAICTPCYRSCVSTSRRTVWALPKGKITGAHSDMDLLQAGKGFCHTKADGSGGFECRLQSRCE
jgi:hypothetical protein